MDATRKSLTTLHHQSTTWFQLLRQNGNHLLNHSSSPSSNALLLCRASTTYRRGVTAAVSVGAEDDHSSSPQLQQLQQQQSVDETRASSSSSACSDGVQLKPMTSLNGPRGWPLVGNFLTYLKKENRGKMHEVQAEQHKMYGKMFREKWGTSWQCHISDPNLMAEVYRQEGVFPNRPSISSWILYRLITGMPYGLSSAQGEEWSVYRAEFGKRMLSPSATRKLIAPFNAVADDLIRRLRQVRDDGGDGEGDGEGEGDRRIVRQLPNEMYKWSLEAAGTFLWEVRLGCLEASIPRRTQEFIDATQAMLASSVYLIIGDKWHQRLNTPVWKKHKDAWDKVFQIAKELIDEKIKALKEQDGSSSVDKSALYLTYLLSNKNLTMDQIYSNVTELLLAGTDTTSNSFCFIVYLLAMNKDVQEKLRDEVLSVLQGRTEVTSMDVEEMKYLKGVIKEGMRLFPVAPMNCRILNEDIVVDGHLIPRKTMFVLNHYASGIDNDTFPNADKFQPERWLRGGGGGGGPETGSHPQHHPFSCLPFGFGKRSCVGQRVAKAELMVTLAKMMQNFDIEVYPGVKLEPVLQILLTPGKNVPIRLIDRK